MNFIDICAGGMGGFRLGMTRAGHKPVGWCELDTAAQKGYKALYDPKGEWFADDIRAVDARTMPDSDCWCFGFPCQDDSIINPNREGLLGQRSGLFFEIVSRAGIKKPKYLFAENVEGLLSVGNGAHFGWLLNSLEELGYIPEWQVCDSRHFIPQRRLRIVVIGHRGDSFQRPIFPIHEIAPISFNTSITETNKTYVNCLLARKGGPSIDETYFCEPGVGTRRPTPRELCQMQGFPVEFADTLQKVLPVGEIRKIVGNSVDPNLIYEIAKRLT